LNKLKISVPLVVKNEERHLKDCLDNLTWVNEVILVDTGSTDGTIDIIYKWCEDNNVNITFPHKGHFTDRGGVVRESKLNIHLFVEPETFLVDFKDKKLFCFDKARNFALDKCTQDYILILDADERIYSPEVLENLMTEHSQVDVWYLFQGSRLSNGKVSPCMSTRFWKNGLGIHYTKMVHETVDEYVDQKGLKRGKTDLMIDHLGFVDDKYNAQKSQRVIDAIEYEGHPYKNYYLGVAYAQMQDTEKAIDYLDASVNDEMPFNIKAHALTLSGDVLRQYGEYYFKMAEERLMHSKRICPNQNLSHIVLAEIKRFKGQNPMRELKKIKRRDYKVSDMHQDLLFTDEQFKQFETEFMSQCTK